MSEEFKIKPDEGAITETKNPKPKLEIKMQPFLTSLGGNSIRHALFYRLITQTNQTYGFCSANVNLRQRLCLQLTEVLIFIKTIGSANTIFI